MFTFVIDVNLPVINWVTFFLQYYVLVTIIHSFYTSLYQLLLNQDSQNEHN